MQIHEENSENLHFSFKKFVIYSFAAYYCRFGLDGTILLSDFFSPQGVQKISQRSTNIPHIKHSRKYNVHCEIAQSQDIANDNYVKKLKLYHTIDFINKIQMSLILRKNGTKFGINKFFIKTSDYTATNSAGK